MDFQSLLKDERVAKYSSYLFSVIFFLLAIGSLEDSLLAVIISLTVGLYLIPPLRNRLWEEVELSPPQYSTIGITLVAFILVGSLAPADTQPETAELSPELQNHNLETGEMLELSLDYYNPHDEALTYEITLTADNSEETQTLTIEPEETQTINFETELSESIKVTGEDGHEYLTETITTEETESEAEFEIQSSSLEPVEGETPLEVTGTITVANTGSQAGSFTVELHEELVMLEETEEEIEEGTQTEITVSFEVQESGSSTFELYGYNSEDEQGEPLESETVSVAESEPEPIELTGSNPEATETFNLEEGLTVFDLSHTGSSNFQVWLLDENGNEEESLANRIGSFEGSTAYGAEQGEYLLDVEADGDWEIEITQPRTLSGEELPQTYSDNTKLATSFFEADGLTEFEMSHEGDGNFQVWVLDDEGNQVESLANEIGEYEGSTATNLQGTHLLDVNANGDWDISVE